MRHRRLRTVVSVLASAWYIVCGGVVVANALTQQNLYQLGINYFDLSTACGSSTDDDTSAANSLNGGDQTTAQQIAGNFIIGFDAGTPKSVITDLATKYHIGGMFLTGTKDAAGAGFNKSFYDSLQKASGSGMVISSDEEGVVTRYDYGNTSFPSAGEMAKKSDSDVTDIGKATGKIMAGNGLGVDLAPVLDLRDVGDGLNGRSFSSNSSAVAEKAGAFAAGLQASGITPVFKHFPGFDSTTSGSTDNQKVVMNGSIDKTVKPYKTLLAKYPDAGVMLSNMYVTKLDNANPSSLSAATVDYLRSTMDFNGLITTDDLSVNSVVNKAGSLASAVDSSIDAGVDMPLFTLGGSTTNDAENKLDKIIAAVQNDSAAMSAIQKAQSVVDKYKGGNITSTSSSAGANCCGASSTTLTGDDNPSKTWNYLKGQGLDDLHAAAVMGNIQAESGFDPTNIQNPAGDTKDPSNISAGWGIAQWTPGSKTQGLMDNAKIKTPVYELGSQLELVWYEMNHTTPKGVSNFIKPFEQLTDLDQATLYFESNFEGPQELNDRGTFAKSALDKFGGSGSTGSTAGSSDSSCSQAPVDCTSAQGVAKILCAAKAYDKASYVYAAGPRSGPDWHKQCPTIGPSCNVDCSLLVTLAVYDAFKVVLPGTDTGGERSDEGKYWKKISFGDLQPGDIIQPDPGHVEVVDHIDKKKNIVYTFGAHMAYANQAKDVSPSSYQDNSGNLYLHFIGDTTQ